MPPGSLVSDFHSKSRVSWEKQFKAHLSGKIHNKQKAAQVVEIPQPTCKENSPVPLLWIPPNKQLLTTLNNSAGNTAANQNGVLLNSIQNEDDKELKIQDEARWIVLLVDAESVGISYSQLESIRKSHDLTSIEQVLAKMQGQANIRTPYAYFRPARFRKLG